VVHAPIDFVLFICLVELFYCRSAPVGRLNEGHHKVVQYQNYYLDFAQNLLLEIVAGLSLDSWLEHGSFFQHPVELQLVLQVSDVSVSRGRLASPCINGLAELHGVFSSGVTAARTAAGHGPQSLSGQLLLKSAFVFVWVVHR